MLLDGWWWFCTKSKNVDHPVINLMTQKWDNHWDKLYYSVIETKDSSPSNQRKDVLIWCKMSLIVFQCELRTIGRVSRLKWEQSWGCLFVCWVWGVWGGWRRWPDSAPLSSVVHPRSQFSASLGLAGADCQTSDLWGLQAAVWSERACRLQYGVRGSAGCSMECEVGSGRDQDNVFDGRLKVGIQSYFCPKFIEHWISHDTNYFQIFSQFLSLTFDWCDVSIPELQCHLSHPDISNKRWDISFIFYIQMTFLLNQNPFDTIKLLHRFSLVLWIDLLGLF